MATTTGARLIAYLAVWLAVAATLVLGAAAEAQTSIAPPLGLGGAKASDIDKIARRYFPTDDAAPSPKRIFRLTRDQIDATVASLLPGILVPPLRTVMARDPLQTNYEYADLLSINGANHGLLAGWIAEIAARVQKKPESVIACAASGQQADCLSAAARRFILKAFRGDVSEERVAKYVAFYIAALAKTGFGAATADLVEVVLNAPDFLFRRETDVGALGRLLPEQLLQSVTYTLADQPPDFFELQSDAAAQYLTTGPDAAKTITKLLSTAATRAKLKRFLIAWLEIREAGDFTLSSQSYPEFTTTAAAAMVSGARHFLDQHLAKPAPTLKDITQAIGTASAADQSDAIAAKLAELEPPQRLGIFTEPAVVASHSGPTGTRPIKRGVFWARKVLCLPLGQPPKELHATLDDIAGATERQRIEQSTRRGACAGCHKVINPLGFMLENYDALGRWRSHDNGKPIDARVLIDFLGEPAVAAAKPLDALRALTSSDQFKQCFVRQMFRFYMGRAEAPTDDPVLRRMFTTFAADDDQDLLRTLYVLTSSDRIVRRQ